MKRLLLFTALAALAPAACTETYDYDAATAGDPEGTARPHGKTSSQFVRTAFADLLGRAPDSHTLSVRVNGQEVVSFQVDEERQLVGTLDGLGDSLPLRNLLVAGLLHSDEVTLPEKSAVADPRAFIRGQFTRLLGREPNAYELEAFAAEWAADPAVGPRTLIRAIVGSREYQSQ
ncbi:MAG: hypothetical protein KIT31_37215 [Deltaproteobacteria bacterium]|nr:hypothetical protein [Deltaproteobacteria bacterium]